jgi:hypothetical protein
MPRRFPRRSACARQAEMTINQKLTRVLDQWPDFPPRLPKALAPRPLAPSD